MTFQRPSFLSNDAKDEKTANQFLREGLSPLFKKYNCAGIIMHHTPKTQFNPSADFSTTDFKYRGAGCASMSNWARAYLVFEPITHSERIFRFVGAKRGKRIGWENTIEKYFCHSSEPGVIDWVEPTADDLAEIAAVKAGKVKEKKIVAERLGIPRYQVEARLGPADVTLRWGVTDAAGWVVQRLDGVLPFQTEPGPILRTRAEAYRRLHVTVRVAERILVEPVAWMETGVFNCKRFGLYSESQLQEIASAISDGTIKVQRRSLHRSSEFARLKRVISWQPTLRLKMSEFAHNDDLMSFGLGYSEQTLNSCSQDRRRSGVTRGVALRRLPSPVGTLKIAGKNAYLWRESQIVALIKDISTGAVKVLPKSLTVPRFQAYHSPARHSWANDQQAEDQRIAKLRAEPAFWSRMI